jgi:hypothetical protein
MTIGESKNQTNRDKLDQRGAKILKSFKFKDQIARLEPGTNA